MVRGRNLPLRSQPQQAGGMAAGAASASGALVRADTHETLVSRAPDCPNFSAKPQNFSARTRRYIAGKDQVTPTPVVVLKTARKMFHSQGDAMLAHAAPTLHPNRALEAVASVA